MQRKLKLYISLPISGHDNQTVRERASRLKEWLTSSVCEPITPFDVCPEQNKPYSYYMGRDIEALLECDAIFMADGWKFSKGCICERSTAIIYGLKTFYEEDFRPKIDYSPITPKYSQEDEIKKYFSNLILPI